jgi:hypothetical protein
VAITTGGVAARTVIIEHGVKSWVIFGDAALLHDGPIAAQAAVQAVGKWPSDIGVAIGADVIGSVTGSSNQILVSGIFVTGLDAAMTAGAGDAAMNGIEEFTGVDEYFFPRLQRSHFAPSANPFGFGLVILFFGFGRIDQALFIYVAIQALIGLNCGDRDRSRLEDFQDGVGRLAD